MPPVADVVSGLTLLWRAIVTDGRLSLWQLIRDTPERRAEFGLALGR
ncbi:MAG: hypothetical protein J2P29_03530 [Actinobacteria bacterium]|nr:hypothetical protein [Actinomycetota bacterium]